jgi:hypothetical protein
MPIKHAHTSINIVGGGHRSAVEHSIAGLGHILLNFGGWGGFFVFRHRLSLRISGAKAAFRQSETVRLLDAWESEKCGNSRN